MAAPAPRRWRLCSIATGLLCAALLSSANASVPHIDVHRRRTCAFVALWDVRFADIASTSALESEQLWTRVERENCSIASTGTKSEDDEKHVSEPCWKRKNVQVADGKLVLSAGRRDSGGKGEAAKARAEKHIQGSWSGVNHVQVIAKFPEGDDTAEAMVIVHVLPLDVQMSIGIGPRWSENQRVVHLSSSQNANLLAEIPCITDVRSHYHVIGFSWDSRWLRWYFDETIIYEEPIRDTAMETSESDDRSLAIDLIYASASPTKAESSAGAAATALLPSSAASSFQIERIHLKQGDLEDPGCSPQHRTNANCRKKTHFQPRLGSNQGYLSTQEIEKFINETVDRLPSGFARVEKIGTSVQGRSILALCVGACYSADLIPQALYTGMHHSRENLIYTIDLLATDLEDGDLEVLHLLFSRQMWFVLVVNPDGYARNEKQRIWERSGAVGQRKNTQPGCMKEIDNGVDLNRNYDVCFRHDNVGSSTQICAEDYRGPNPFSEPETQAIRDFVERSGMNFSTGLNYHSYGRYFNIPFACEANGLPPQPQLAIFQDMAAEMTRYNHFKYGQPWKESNLYTVNGETSDWMWQKHGIYAMSPEVGPDFGTRDSLGFWPPQDQVPSLSTELHYTNVYAAIVAGALYDLQVTRLDVTASHISVQISLSNVGLRTAGKLELMGSMFPNGSHSSDITEVLPNELGTVEAKQTIMKSLEVPMRHINSASHIQLPVYIVLRDAFGCHLHRIAIDFESSVSTDAKSSSFQVWSDFRLPRCGLCASFGSPTSSMIPPLSSQDPKCASIEDVTTPHGIRLKRPVIQSSKPQSTEQDEPADDPGSAAETPAPSATPPSGSTTSTTGIPESSAESYFLRTQSDSSSIFSSWFSSSFYVMPLVGLVVFALILLVFIYRRRAARNANSDAVPTKRNSRPNPRYSRVVNDEVTPSPQDFDDESGEFDGSDSDDDDLELELVLDQGARRQHGRHGRRPGSPLRAARSPSPVRRPLSPRRQVQSDEVAV